MGLKWQVSLNGWFLNGHVSLNYWLENGHVSKNHLVAHVITYGTCCMNMNG
jgi:hypothetical protein